MLDNKVLNMSPGEALLDAPVPDLIQKLALAIAEAQLRLDQTGVRVATLLSEAKVDFKDANGKTTTKSLLELGFTPTFYHFTEAEIEVKLTLALKVSEGFSVGGSASLNVGGGKASPPKSPDNRAVVFGATINAEYHRKYEFDMSGSSTIHTKLVSVPAPSVFLNAIRDNARGGGSIG